MRERRRRREREREREENERAKVTEREIEMQWEGETDRERDDKRRTYELMIDGLSSVLPYLSFLFFSLFYSSSSLSSPSPLSPLNMENRNERLKNEIHIILSDMKLLRLQTAKYVLQHTIHFSLPFTTFFQLNLFRVVSSICFSVRFTSMKRVPSWSEKQPEHL